MGDGLGSVIQACRDLTSEELQLKRRSLIEARRWLVYDLYGETRDAFSLLMERIRTALPKLYDPSILRTHARAIQHSCAYESACEPRRHYRVCQNAWRHGLFRKLPPSLGLADNTEKAWAHSFGEGACWPLDLWQPPSRFFKVQGSTAPEMVVEQYAVLHMSQALDGTTMWLKALVASP